MGLVCWSGTAEMLLSKKVLKHSIWNYNYGDNQYAKTIVKKCLIFVASATQW